MTVINFEDFGITKEDIKSADEHASMIEFCTLHTADSRQFWNYLSILPSKYPEYKGRYAQGGALNPLDFGKVLASGWGDTPPDDVIADMKEEYGTSLTYEKDLTEAFKKEIEKQQNELNIKNK